MKKFLMLSAFTFLFTPFSFAGNCNYPDDLDSAGRRCGGRAASVRPGGRLGGDGIYKDSYGRKRLWGKDNDPYDKPRSSNLYEFQKSY